MFDSVARASVELGRRGAVLINGVGYATAAFVLLYLVLPRS
jgi:hypothetical protein